MERLEELYKGAGVAVPRSVADLAPARELFFVKFCVHLIAEPGEKFEEVIFKATYKDKELTTVKMFPSEESRGTFRVGYSGPVSLTPALDFQKGVSAIFLKQFPYEWTNNLVDSSGEEEHFCRWRFKKRGGITGDIPLYAIVQIRNPGFHATVTIGAAFHVQVSHGGTFDYNARVDSDLILLKLPDL